MQTPTTTTRRRAARRRRPTRSCRARRRTRRPPARSASPRPAASAARKTCRQPGTRRSWSIESTASREQVGRRGHELRRRDVVRRLPAGSTTTSAPQPGRQRPPAGGEVGGHDGADAARLEPADHRQPDRAAAEHDRDVALGDVAAVDRVQRDRHRLGEHRDVRARARWAPRTTSTARPAPARRTHPAPAARARSGARRAAPHQREGRRRGRPRGTPGVRRGRARRTSPTNSWPSTVGDERRMNSS